MATVWICPQGHQSQIPGPGSPPACPFCGQPLGQVADTLIPPKRPGDVTVDSPTDPSLNVGLLGTPPGPAPTPPVPPPVSPSVAAAALGAVLPEVPGYEIIEELGRGGMGVVYKARQVRLNRLVALKMILAAEHAGPEQRARFQIEAEAVARLHHPNIVQIYDVGESNGRPYFSLEFVAGGSLSAKLDGKPQSPRVAAAVAETLARAMAAAHAQGIVHRDLKPANVLLADPSAGSTDSLGSTILRAQNPLGIPKITDFGLAKRLEGGGGQTHSGAIMGTPSYMAPEQAAGRAKEVGPATDVYSIGAILYELLTGRPPFQQESPLDTILSVVRDEPAPPRQFQPKLHRDVEIICLKSLEKEPKKRYATAQALADDLRRFLDGEPITARPVTRWERARKWTRRHPVWAAASGVAILAGIGLLFGGMAYHARLTRALAETAAERDLVAEERRLALRRNIRLTVSGGEQYLDQQDLLKALPWFAEALRMEDGGPEREEMHRIRLAAVLRQCPRLTQAWFNDGRTNEAVFSPDGNWVLSASDDGSARLFAVSGAGAGDACQTFAHPGAVLRVAFRPDGARFLTVCADHAVRVWDVETGKPVGGPLLHGGAVTGASFSPDGKRVLTTCSGRAARLWDAEGTCEPVILRHAAPVLAGTFAPDGERLATASADGTVLVWDAKTGRPASPPMTHGGAVGSVRFSPDGRKLATGSADRTARVWDAATGKPLAPPLRHAGTVTEVEFSPDGRLVVTASADNTARVWDAETGDWVTHSFRHGSAITHVDFSPDGRLVATASDDNTARVWDVAASEPATPPLQHTGTVFSACFSPDGQFVLTASQGGIVRLWDIAAGRLRPAAVTAVKANGSQVVYSPDRKRVLKVGADGAARVYDAGTDHAVGPPLRHRGAILHAAFSPDGKGVLTAGADRTARVWEVETGEAKVTVRHASDVQYASFAPDGRSFVTASTDNTARVWDAQTGDPRTPPLRHNGSVQRAVFSRDGRCVLTGSEDGTARAWDAATGEALSPAMPPSGWVGAALASSGHGGGWDLPADRHSPEYLVLLAQWLSGHRLDATGGLVPLDGDALRETWQKLKAAGGIPGRDAAELRAWHRQEAAASEAARDWFAAAFHLGILIRVAEEARPEGGRLAPRVGSDSLRESATPDRLHARRARAYAEQGRWPEAAADFAKAIELGADEEALLIAAALAHLAAGDEQGYRKACGLLLERCGVTAHGDAACRLAWVCVLAPAATGEANGPLAMADKALNEGPERPVCGVVKGAALVRADKCADAVPVLTDAAVLADPTDAVRAWLFLALASHRLNKPEEAKRWLAQAQRWIDFRCDCHGKERAGRELAWTQRLELRLLRAEVEKMLGDAAARGE